MNADKEILFLFSVGVNLRASAANAGSLILDALEKQPACWRRRTRGNPAAGV
jgi:hypothetical protein